MRPPVIASAGFVLALGLGFAPAAAAPKDDRETVEARKHIDKAKVHYKLGEFEQAVSEFKEAYRLKPVAPILFNIAQAYRMTGDYKQSRFNYQNYLRDLPNAPNKQEVERQLEQLAELIAEQESSGRTATKPAPEPRVETAAAKPAEPVAVKPSPEPVAVKPPPEPVVTPPAKAELPAAVTAPPMQPLVEEEGPPSRVLPIALGVAAAVFAVAGGVTYGLARSDWTAATASERPRTEVDQLIAAGDGKRGVSLGLGGAALAAGLGSAVLFVF